MRVAGYCRVSTDSQGERGYGLESQRLLIEAETEHRQWTMHELYIDVASGGTTKRRPEFTRAVTALQHGDADVLMVGKLDRLSRSLLSPSWKNHEMKRQPRKGKKAMTSPAQQKTDDLALLIRNSAAAQADLDQANQKSADAYRAREIAQARYDETQEAIWRAVREAVTNAQLEVRP